MHVWPETDRSRWAVSTTWWVQAPPSFSLFSWPLDPKCQRSFNNNLVLPSNACFTGHSSCLPTCLFVAHLHQMFVQSITNKRKQISLPSLVMYFTTRFLHIKHLIVIFSFYCPFFTSLFSFIPHPSPLLTSLSADHLNSPCCKANCVHIPSLLLLLPY